ncbi:MAG: hypothetical protein RBR52_14925 [Thiomonas sp.]|uniref:YobI family P-loop NTPase n=1 Tax=Thiomonas sp. TaxID=2047785 RepID=UPI002A358BE3|nr:hypothetical protein [Thiomonas sp.]MDY0331769.1 hypothetical protein [Thiomonas sp.]
MIRNIIRRICTQKRPVSNKSWDLISLTPKFLEEEHGGYVTAIKAALEDDQIRNIALSGSFGVGKSSILQEVARQQSNRVVEISLSTLAPMDTSKPGESVPAHTPTNRIQQEIVKQLLYREYPRKTPGSRFRRIERCHRLREFILSLLLGFVVAVIFLLNGWTEQIISVFAYLVDGGVWGHVTVLGVATTIALLVRWLLYGKFHIRQISAGAATVSLDDKSVSYFDQYLDEIVYFFEVSKRDIVIFEDIDRFNDSHIFETLRALNTLLNASAQIKKPIRFIYAIRDSIFDCLGLTAEGRKLDASVYETGDPARTEAVRANRTKFFDLVIPVVPFITHRSARDLATQLLDGIDHKVKQELLDLAAQFVPDMRLLKNVRNEFIVFRDRIFSGAGKQLKLNETDLFAMMLYKSTHLTDFENIRLSKSNLDIMYRVSRELVTKNIMQIEGERRDLLQQRTRLDTSPRRSQQLGEKLIAHVQLIMKAIGQDWKNSTYTFNRDRWSTDDLKGTKFWTDFVAAGEGAKLQLKNDYPYSGLRELSFTRSNLARALDDPLDAESWNKADRKELTKQIEKKNMDVKFLRRADFADLIKRPEFVVEYKENEQSFGRIARDILKPGLAYHLVCAGYINRNFTLYTSTFHSDRVGPAATNFIIHHIEQDQMDEHFELAPDDVDAIVRERGKGALKEPVLYNISILDHLLSTDDSAVDTMIRSLASLEDSQVRFLRSYLSAGSERTKFIRGFSAVSWNVLEYLVNEAVLDDVPRRELVNITLEQSSVSKQQTDDSVSSYLLEHYTDFKVLTSDATTSDQAESIGVLFADAGITVPHLEPLGLKVRSSFVSRNLYEITYENLKIAIDSTTSMALDAIREASETVYNYMLEHLNAYLDAINGISVTVDTDEGFLIVIKDVLKQEVSSLGAVIEHADPDCEVADLTAVSEEAWPILAKYQRFPATFNNILAYFEVHEDIDEHLAETLIVAGEITEVNTADEEKKMTLALAILTAQDHIPDEILRVQLVRNLSLAESINIDDIKAETGDLFALLLEYNIIADETKSYEHLAETDWSTRKAFILKSTKFIDYMSPELICQDLAELLKSDEIDSAVKAVILDQAAAYVNCATPDALQELAQFATGHGHELPLDVVQKMAEAAVASSRIVSLLEPHLVSIGTDELFTILRTLDGGYPDLTEVGRARLQIPNTSADRALLQRLKQDGIVSTYDEHKSQLKVNRKHK